jgi:hypothetical protein
MHGEKSANKLRLTFNTPLPTIGSEGCNSTPKDFTMRFDKTARELAAKLLAEGYDIFTEDLRLELATRQFRRAARNRMVPFGYNEVHLKPTKQADDTSADFAIDDIKQSGPPGSQARIEAYQNHYAEKNDTQSILPAHTLDFEQLGDRIVDILGLQRAAPLRDKLRTKLQSGPISPLDVGEARIESGVDKTESEDSNE